MLQVEGGAMGQDRAGSLEARLAHKQADHSLAKDSRDTKWSHCHRLSRLGDDGQWFLHRHLQCIGEDGTWTVVSDLDGHQPVRWPLMVV